jgi:hypothetical protein
LNGSIISKSEKVTIKVCSRSANIPGGGAASSTGINHQFVVGPDGPPVGMGPIGTNGNPGPSYPGVPTEWTDHSGESQDNCIEYEVNRCEFGSRTQLGDDLGPWLPPFNQCNSCVNDVLRASGGFDNMSNIPGMFDGRIGGP